MVQMYVLARLLWSFKPRPFIMYPDPPHPAREGRERNGWYEPIDCIKMYL